jgi:hypothetical protein
VKAPGTRKRPLPWLLNMVKLRKRTRRRRRREKEEWLKRHRYSPAVAKITETYHRVTQFRRSFQGELCASGSVQDLVFEKAVTRYCAICESQSRRNETVLTQQLAAYSTFQSLLDLAVLHAACRRRKIRVSAAMNFRLRLRFLRGRWYKGGVSARVI